MVVSRAAAIPLALYVHIPWCVRKCPYCDFNSHALSGPAPQTEYVDALLADLDADLVAYPDARARPIVSVFFGGGTPSVFSPAAIARILDGVAARLNFAREVEITLETNPGTVEHGPFAGYRDAGVNRLSFGVQSFDDAALARLGRIHGADEARRAVRAAQDAGLRNINIDLMYALPAQSMSAALDDIAQALALSPTHVSHYHLTLEPNTLFAAKPPPDLPEEDAAWAMQEACQSALADAGYAQYEVSAYARDAQQCLHNRNYWQFGDYLGIGAGAHAKLTDAEGTVHRLWKLKHPKAYLDACGTQTRLGGVQRIAPEQLPFEFMLNALRLNEGFTLSLFEQRTGLARATIAERLGDAQMRGWLEVDAGRVVPTELGRRFLNDTIAAFLPE
jgi:oxygen-independent coproporphyrinogen-3 oxidase